MAGAAGAACPAPASRGDLGAAGRARAGPGRDPAGRRRERAGCDAGCARARCGGLGGRRWGGGGRRQRQHWLGAGWGRGGGAALRGTRPKLGSVGRELLWLAARPARGFYLWRMEIRNMCYIR